MVFWLAFFACTNGDSVAVKPPPPMPPPIVAARRIPGILLANTEPLAMPTGNVIVNNGCYQETSKPTPKPAPPTMSRRPYPSPPQTTPSPTAAAPMTPAPVKSSSYDDNASSSGFGVDGLAGTKGGGTGGESRSMAASGAARPARDEVGATEAAPAEPYAEKAAEAPAPPPVPRATRTKDVVADKKESSQKAPADLGAEGKTRAGPSDGDAARAVREEAEYMPEKQDKWLDWGATIYLSNDDSMSLASAQHLLHAVKAGESFGPGDVRPHELLNYFSFDSAPVADGELFSVLGAARKLDGDSMSVALAVKGAVPPRRPLDLTVVVDRSGSMSAEGRMEYVRRGLLGMTNNLVTGDRIDLVLFDNAVCTPLENYVVGRDDPSLLTNAISQMAPKGGTNIGIGLKEAYRIAASPDRLSGTVRARRVMLLTDAQTNQGEIDPDALASVGEAYEKQGIRLAGIGVGVGFNDKILDTVTDRGHGAYVYLGSEAVVDRVFGSGFNALTQTIAHDVHFALDLPPSLAMEKFYGEESSTHIEDVQAINFYAGNTQLFLQDLTVNPNTLAPSDEIVLTITYNDALTDEPDSTVWKTTVGELLKADGHNVTKARALMGWTDVLTARALGADACGAPLREWVDRSKTLADDAEITYVNKLVGNWCTVPELDVALAGVAFKVRVDADLPIAEVELDCGQNHYKQTLSGGDNIARFDAPPGACRLTLQGNMPMEAMVKVPESGGDVKCMIRAGRMSCG